jgi:MazG family protein
MPSNSDSRAGEKFDRLVEIMAKLRGPGGCPWDREQTFATIKPYLLEETYEVMDSIDAKDWPGLQEELGDLLLQPVFFAQMATEEGRFSISDSLDAINNKLVRRHPHIFSDGQAHTADDVKTKWDQIKAEENAEKGRAPEAMLDTISKAQPALSEAQQISSKVARVGFDWPGIEPVFEKLDEELKELREAKDQEHIAEELGDLMFVVVNLARHLKVDAEQALRAANAKFRRRFAYVEQQLTLSESTLEEMEAKWQEAKRLP